MAWYPCIMGSGGSATASCSRVVYADFVGNDTEEIPVLRSKDEGAEYSTYLSYDTSTKKFTVLNDFSGFLVIWVYSYRTSGSTIAEGAFYINGTRIDYYVASSASQGSTGGKIRWYDFQSGDTFWPYTPNNHGYPQQRFKIYKVETVPFTAEMQAFSDEEAQ